MLLRFVRNKEQKKVSTLYWLKKKRT